MLVKEELEELYLGQKLTMLKVAQQLYVSGSSVCRAIHRFGIPINHPKATHACATLPAVEAKQLYEGSGLGIEAIALRYGVSPNTVSRRLKSLGVEVSQARAGERNSQYVDGKSYRTDGYIAVRAPSHPRADSNGRVLEHILVWEKYHHRLLPKDWNIHHLNGVKDDNRSENLVAMSRAGHSRRETGELYKKRIRELEVKNEKLKETLESRQLIFKIKEVN